MHNISSNAVICFYRTVRRCRCIWNFSGQTPRYSLHSAPRSCKVWHSRQGSNLQPAVLETAALPLELPEYKTPPLESNLPWLLPRTRSKLRSGGHIANKNSPRFAAGAACVDAHPAGHAGPLRFPVLLFTGGGFRAWARFQESHTHPHTGGELLHASDMPRYRLCGVRCEAVESNHIPSPGSVGCPNAHLA